MQKPMALVCFRRNLRVPEADLAESEVEMPSKVLLKRICQIIEILYKIKFFKINYSIHVRTT